KIGLHLNGPGRNQAWPVLQGREVTRTRPERECLVDSTQFGIGKLQVSGCRIFGSMGGARRLGYGKERRTPNQEAQRHLSRSGLVRGGDFLQYASPLGTRTRKAAVAKRAVAHQRDAVFLTPGQHRVLDSPFLKVVQDLIAGYVARAGDLERLLQVGDVKIADAPGENLPLALKLLERADRV